MSKKLDQIRQRKARIEAELAKLGEAEREAEKLAKQRRERSIIRAIRKSGILSHDEVVVVREITSLAARLSNDDSITESVCHESGDEDHQDDRVGD